MIKLKLLYIPVIIVSFFIGVVLLIDFLSGKDYDSEWILAGNYVQWDNWKWNLHRFTEGWADNKIFTNEFSKI